MNEKAKVIAKAYEAFGRGDVASVLALVDDNCDWNGPASKEIPYHGKFKGPSGAAKFFDGIMSSVRVTSFEPKTYTTEGDTVMTTGVWSGVALATNKPFTAIWAMHFIVKNGKITYTQTYEDTAATSAAFRK
jgi:uncharacterized protein